MAIRRKQEKGEATEFANRFQAIVKEVNPAYERNKLVRGIRLEFLREVLPGVFASHNVFCLHGRYYHGFCITLHRELPTPYLISPLTIGGRLDHNNCSKMAYFRDVEPNRRWPFRGANFSASHSYRKGWEQIAAKCTRIAEERMLPHYLKQFEKFKPSVRALLERLQSVGEVPIEIDRKNSYPCTLFPFDYDLQRFAKRFNDPTIDRTRFLDEILQLKPELFNKVRTMNSLTDLLSTLAK